VHLIKQTVGDALFYVKHLSSVARFFCSDQLLRDNNFLIFGRGRSGSTALVSLLDRVPGIQCDDEILNRWAPFPLEQILSRSHYSKSRSYGCKLLSYQLRDVQKIADQTGFLLELQTRGFRLIYLRRDNLLLHAISNIRAREFGFHQRRGSRRGGSRVHVDIQQLLIWMRSSELLYRYEKEVLAGLHYLELIYEQHIENERDHEKTLATICDFLKIEYPTHNIQSEIEKISPRRLSESVDNYEEIVVALSGTPFSQYLNESDHVGA
jgi:LPS sulfotransferase NodH